MVFIFYRRKKILYLQKSKRKYQRINLEDNIYLYKENRTSKEDSENELDNYAIWYDSNTNESIEFMYDDNNNLVRQEVVHKLETLPIIL